MTVEQSKDKLGKCTQKQIISGNKEIELRYIIRNYKGREGNLFRLSLRNKSRGAVKVGKVYVLDAVSNVISCLELGGNFGDFLRRNGNGIEACKYEQFSLTQIC